jgi:hypothetical protein
MTPLLRLAMSFVIAAVSGVVGYIATLAVIAWGQHCRPNGASCSLGGAVGLTVATTVALAAAIAVGILTWRRLGRFSARANTRAG